MIRAAVKSYQKAKKLTVDGCVGDQTWGSLFPPARTVTATNSVSAELKKYLVPTKNCQSNDPTIIAVAKQLTAGLTSDMDKAIKIFNWARDVLNYKFHYDTVMGQ
jgi:transglutaminase-like putative cysteine protease